MDNIQNALAKILATFINGTELLSFPEDLMTQQFFCDVLEEAMHHQVHTMVFSVLNDYLPSHWFTESLAYWKTVAFATVINKVTVNKGLSCVLNELNEANIAFVGLKGLYLQTLYQEQQMRTMSDVDLLIKFDDIQNVDNVLTKLGYKRQIDACTQNVFTYKHDEYINLEIHHKTFGDNDGIPNLEKFDEIIWSNLCKKPVLGTEVLFPQPFYHCVYMIIHMAKHFVFSGFGLRQLIDLYLIIVKENLDVLELVKAMKAYDLERFTIMLLLAVNRLFQLELPELIFNSSLSNNEYLDNFIDEVFKDGVFGKKNSEQVAKHIAINHEKSKLGLIFPSRKNLKSRYWYATKYGFLLPIAWVHRWIYSILRRDMTFSHKLSILKKSKKQTSTRLEMLRWLSLT